jgi:DNA-binding NtrC family response regulator
VQVAVIDDTEAICAMLAAALVEHHDVTVFSRGFDLLVDVDFGDFDVAIIDSHLEPDNFSTELAVRILRHLALGFPGVYRILYSGFPTTDELLIGLVDEQVEKGRLQDICEAVERGLR